MKIVDCCESNKRMGRVCVSRISMRPSKLQGKTAGSQGEGPDKRRKMSVKECKVENPVGKNCPLKTVALAVDEKAKAIKRNRGRAQSLCRPSWVWEARVECRWHSNVVWEWMKNIRNDNKMKNNNKTNIKNEWSATTNITKSSLKVPSSKVTSLRVFVESPCD